MTSNRRATLVSVATRAKLTVDSDLTCGWGTAGISLRPDVVVLESKVEDHVSPVDRMLRSAGWASQGHGGALHPLFPSTVVGHLSEAVMAMTCHVRRCVRGQGGSVNGGRSRS